MSDTDPTTADAARVAAKDTAGTAAEQGKAVASTAADQGKAVAGTAAEQAGNVAGVAKEQLLSVTDQARGQARQVMSGASSELQGQLEQRLGDLASGARTMVTELQALLEGRPEEGGRSADLARQASSQLERLADRADDLGVRGVVEEVGDFARRRPALFLAGAAFTGVLVGRMARAGKEAQSSEGDSSYGQLSATADGPSGLGAPYSGVGEGTTGATYPSTIGTGATPAAGDVGTAPATGTGVGTSGWGVTE